MGASPCQSRAKGALDRPWCQGSNLGPDAAESSALSTCTVPPSGHSLNAEVKRAQPLLRPGRKQCPQASVCPEAQVSD